MADPHSYPAAWSERLDSVADLYKLKVKGYSHDGCGGCIAWKGRGQVGTGCETSDEYGENGLRVQEVINAKLKAIWWRPS